MQARGIMRVSANGGEPELLVAVQPPQTADTPQIIDRGKALLFTLAERGADRWEKAQVVVQSLRSNERKVVFRGGSAARYLPTGHLMYQVNGTILVVPFDLQAREIRGGPIPILDGVLRPVNSAMSTGDADFAVSDSGSLVYIPGLSGGASAQQTTIRTKRPRKESAT